MTESFRKVLESDSVKHEQPPRARADRTILLADSTVPFSEVQAAVDRQAATAFYWLGSADQLTELITRHIAQSKKRLAGPTESPICDAL